MTTKVINEDELQDFYKYLVQRGMVHERYNPVEVVENYTLYLVSNWVEK